MNMQELRFCGTKQTNTPLMFGGYIETTVLKKSIINHAAAKLKNCRKRATCCSEEERTANNLILYLRSGAEKVTEANVCCTRTVRTDLYFGRGRMCHHPVEI